MDRHALFDVQETFNSAMLAAGSSIETVDQVVSDKVDMIICLRNFDQSIKYLIITIDVVRVQLHLSQ